MKKILNVHLNDDPDQYQCIGCSPHNPIGIKLEFWDEGEGLYAEWLPRREFMGWVNVLHGGIQATLLDEIAAWVVYTKCRTAGVTTEMQVKYTNPVYTNQGKVVLRGRLLEQNKRIATILAQLFNAEGILCTEARINYFIYSENVARKKFHYPGVQAFYEQTRND
ncbi:PaaI family thioesterase [Gaoshiqia sp. Z1-71]|uniref:PaaI family thioesterase n=1 Tax=Gaoshiqia hydrogeniformans TaxID=3290090 RepID=UPI003BF7D095